MENNLSKPALYDHVSYKRAMHFTLSTSQVRLIYLLKIQVHIYYDTLGWCKT
jgi:hypothetical protein